MDIFQIRFGEEFDKVSELSNDLINSQLSRATIRSFIDKPLEEGLLELLVAASSCSATSGALQTYSVIALTTPEEKEKLFSTEQSRMVIGAVDSHNVKAIKGCSVFLIWVADLHRIDVLLKQLTTDNELLAQTARAEYNLKAIIDATIAAQSFAMLAESKGLGTMYCGAIRQLPAEHFEKEFGLPKLTFPVFGMAVGYPADDATKTIRPRFSTDLILHCGTYKALESLEDFEKENKFHRGSVKTNNLGRYTYTQRIIERMNVTGSKKGVSSSLKHMGFNFD